MQDEGFVFGSEHARRLKQAYDLTLERLRVEPCDHDVKKRLARTLIKIAKRRAENATPEALADATVDQACDANAPQDRLSPWLETVRRSPPPTIVPWQLVQRLRSRRNTRPLNRE